MIAICLVNFNFVIVIVVIVIVGLAIWNKEARTSTDHGLGIINSPGIILRVDILPNAASLVLLLPVSAVVVAVVDLLVINGAGPALTSISLGLAFALLLGNGLPLLGFEGQFMR